jgi:hypothetical protein
MIAEKVKIKPNYYKGINDLPIWNFDILCKSKGNDWKSEYLLKDIDDEAQEGFDAEEHWTKIYDEYLEAYGLGEDYKQWCQLIKKAGIARREAYLEGKTYKKTHAEIFQREADELIRNMENQGGDLSVACANLTKYMGVIIDPTKISVRQFNSYLEVAKKDGTNG